MSSFFTRSTQSCFRPLTLGTSLDRNLEKATTREHNPEKPWNMKTARKTIYTRVSPSPASHPLLRLLIPSMFVDLGVLARRYHVEQSIITREYVSKFSSLRPTSAVDQFLRSSTVSNYKLKLKKNGELDA